MDFLWLVALFGFLVQVSELRAQLSATTKGKLTVAKTPVYAGPGSDARITWNYHGDIPQKIMLRVQIKNTTESLDLWTIVVLNSGSDKRIEQNKFIYQTRAKSLSGRTYAEYNHDQFELIVEKFTSNDTQFSFVCVVEFDTFNSIMSQVDILIEAPPVITSFFGGTRRIPKGGIIDLQCSATGNPAPQLEWKKNSQIRSSGIANVNLIIEGIQPEDTGTYTCNAVNQAGSTEKSVAITVTYIEIDQSYTHVRQHSISTKAEVSCPVLGYPKPIYVWEKNGVVVGGQQTLIFNSVGTQDFAIYRCIATNSVGSLSTTIELANKEPVTAERNAGSHAQQACAFQLLVTASTALLFILPR